MIDITCNNCEEVLSKYLCDLPSKWAQQITKVVCEAINSSSLECSDVTKCETLTSLSAFSVNDTEICITYKDENGTSFKRCFDFDDILNDSLDEVDPKCITSQEIWDNMSYKERVQAIIDFACDCVPITTTTSTTTTTTV